MGLCGFKSAPDRHGLVEITYGIEEPHRKCGNATEPVGALVAFGVEPPNLTHLSVLPHSFKSGAESLHSKNARILRSTLKAKREATD